MTGQRQALLGGAIGFVLAFVVSSGIASQRLEGTTPLNGLVANAMTTLAAVVALLTLRAFPEKGPWLLAAQGIGAVLGVLGIHVLLAHDAAAHPWLREDPRQVVNDLVAIFGLLAIVWGCAKRPPQLALMIAALVLVAGYEATAPLWHFDGPVPLASAMRWSVQTFVGGEVTASGAGILTLSLVLA